jgi:hypothetical protein
MADDCPTLTPAHLVVHNEFLKYFLQPNSLEQMKDFYLLVVRMEIPEAYLPGLIEDAIKWLIEKWPPEADGHPDKHKDAIGKICVLKKYIILLQNRQKKA